MPETISLPARDVPVEDYDVVVAGGGPAGATAAIASAREGARTLLVEQFNCLGGMGTAGLVPAWCPFTDDEKVIYRGIGFEIFKELKSQMPHVSEEKLDWVAIDPELLKLIYDRRVIESGAEVRFQTQLVGVLTEKQRLTAAVIANKGGLSAVRARVFIDATGDGDLAAWAGAEFQKGDPDTGEMQPTTLCFTLAGVDTARFQSWREEPGVGRHQLRTAIDEAKAKGDLNIDDHSANIAHQSSSTLGFNFAHIFDIDGTDPSHLSRGMVEGRKLAHHLAAFMKKYCPGCEHAVLVHTAEALGVRESRRIIGDYVLTRQDYIARRSFPDEIARSCYYIDIHMSRQELAAADSGGSGWKERGQPYGPGESHGIPYRCLIPKGLENVLVAGRAISCDRPVQAAVRVMPVCLVMGEAAGCAAGMALAHEGNVRAIDVEQLRQKLKGYGGYLPNMHSATAQ